MVLPPLPDWARNTFVPGRQYAFSDAVLEGQVCINCQYHLHEWFQPQEPDYDYYEPAPPDDDWFDWPWNPIPTPSPPDENDYTEQPGVSYDPPYTHYPPPYPPYTPPDDPDPPYNNYPPQEDDDPYVPDHGYNTGYDS